MPRTTTAHRVCPAADMPPGERRIIDAGGRSIGVFNVHGEYHAIRNTCPHQLAPLCEGPVSGTTQPSPPGEFRYGQEGQIIRCPWHGWEFDLTTGKSVFNPHRCRVKHYDVTVEPGDGAEEDPSVETFDVTVERGWVTVHV